MDRCYRRLWQFPGCTQIKWPYNKDLDITNLKSISFLASQFGNGSSWCKVTTEDSQVASLSGRNGRWNMLRRKSCQGWFETYRLDRCLNSLDNILLFEVKVGNIFVVLGQCLPGNRELCTVDQVGVLEQIFDQSGNTTRFVEIFHNVLSRGTEAHG